MIRFKSLSAMSCGWRNAIVHLTEQRQSTLHHLTNDASTPTCGAASSQDCMQHPEGRQNIRPYCCEDHRHQDAPASNLHVRHMHTSVPVSNPTPGFDGGRTYMTNQRTQSNDRSIPEGFSQSHQHLHSLGDRASASYNGLGHMPMRFSAIAAATVVAAAPSGESDGFSPVEGAMQLMDGLHSVTGLPWWATLWAAAVGELSPSQLLLNFVFKLKCVTCYVLSSRFRCI